MATAPVVVDVTDPGDQGSVTSYSFSHTVSPGCNLLVVCTQARDSSATDIDVSGITWDGDPLTEVRSYYDGGIQDFGVEIWKRDNPKIGTYLVEVTHGGKCTDCAGGAASIRNANLSSLTKHQCTRPTLDAVFVQCHDPVSDPYINIDSTVIHLSYVSDLNSYPNEIAFVDMGNYLGCCGWRENYPCYYAWTGQEYRCQINWAIQGVDLSEPGAWARHRRINRNTLLRR